MFITFIIGTEKKKWEMMAADVYFVGANSVFTKYRYKVYLQLYLFGGGDNNREGLSLFLQLFPL